MRKYRNRILSGFALAIVIYVGLLLFIDSEGKLTADVLSSLRQFPAVLVLPLILVQVAAGLFRFWEWNYFMGVIGARDKMSLLDSAVIFVTGFVMVVSPGKAAELLKSIMVKSKTGIPAAKVAPVVIAERVIDGLAVIAIMVFGILLVGDQIDIGPYRALIFTSAAILAFALITVQIAPLAYFFLNLAAKLPLIKRAHGPLVEFYESSREVFHLRHILATSGMGVGVYLSSAIGFMLILIGFGLTPTWTLFLQAMFISGVAAAVGALSFVPNGAGVTEFTDATMLMAIVAPANPEMTPAIAATSAIMQGFFHKWFRVLVGLSVAFIFRNRIFSAALEADIAEVEAARHAKRITSTSEMSAV